MPRLRVKVAVPENHFIVSVGSLNILLPASAYEYRDESLKYLAWYTLPGKPVATSRNSGLVPLSN